MNHTEARPIYVLAGNYQQAKWEMRDVPPDEWRYVNDARDLMCLHGGTMRVVGTFWERKDAPELWDRAQVAALQQEESR